MTRCAAENFFIGNTIMQSKSILLTTSRYYPDKPIYGSIDYGTE
jgi:hypothetical protein